MTEGEWDLPEAASELEALDPDRAVEWCVERLSDGTSPRRLCEAALWVGVVRGRAEGRGPHGLVTHAVLGAAACASIGAGDRGVAEEAAVQHVAYTVGRYRGGVNDEREGPRRLPRYRPSEVDGDPVDAFLAAALEGECELADHRWLAAVGADPHRAETALWSAGAAGYHLNEHKVVLPAALAAWRCGGPIDPHLYRVAARYAGNHLQEPDRARERRADATVLADKARPAPAGDHARVSNVATGLARSEPHRLGLLVFTSLAEGLAPEDLVAAVALLGAARYAATPTAEPLAAVGPLHAGTGTHAIGHGLRGVTDGAVRYELALASVESPSALSLSAVEELAVPPSDDQALEDLLAALDDGDPDGAADAASAVPPADDAATGQAWAAVRAAAVTDQWMLLHGPKHVVAMEEEFRASDHPARIHFLAAAARTAALARSVEQPISRRLADLRSS